MFTMYNILRKLFRHETHKSLISSLLGSQSSLLLYKLMQYECNSLYLMNELNLVLP